MTLGMAAGNLLSKTGPGAAKVELRHHINALRGGEDYLRILVLQLAQRSGQGAGRKDSGIRRHLSERTAENLASLKLLASRLERELGLPGGTLWRPALAFHNRYQALVGSWIACRPNARRWSQDQPALWASVQMAMGRFQLEAFEKGFQRIERFDEDPEPSEKGAELAAARLFADLVNHPLQERLRRCRRCREFFVAGRSDQLACTARCATALTARNANRRRRKKMRDRQLTRLGTAMKRIASQKSVPADWKKRAARMAHVTPTFVSRALTQAEIKAPGARKSRKRSRRPPS
jgi:hypothetical protein